MEFCPECGAMMLPNDGVLKCNSCGYSNELSDNDEYAVSKKVEAKETVKVLGEDVDVRPTTTETCPECGNDKAYYELKQTRSADEAPTRFFTCTECKHTWREYDWGLFMKDSKEKEHRISNLKDMIDNINDNEVIEEEIEEDLELINYLNEDKGEYEDLEIDDEFIYHPSDDDNAVNLEENNINEDFIIKTPKEEIDVEDATENEEFFDDFTSDMSESFDNIVHAKIGRTPILAIVSTIIGLILIAISATIFSSRSDRVIDNVVSGETNFISVIFLIFGLLLLIYGLYKIIGFKNPLESLSSSIDSVESDEPITKKEVPKEKVIPKSNIPLDKESYKIGEFNLKELKNKFKKPSTPKKPAPPTQEELDKIPPAREKPKEKKGLTADEIEEMEYEQVVREGESIDDIFAEVEDIDEMPIISVDSEDKIKK